MLVCSCLVTLTSLIVLMYIWGYCLNCMLIINYLLTAHYHLCLKMCLKLKHSWHRHVLLNSANFCFSQFFEAPEWVIHKSHLPLLLSVHACQGRGKDVPPPPPCTNPSLSLFNTHSQHWKDLLFFTPSLSDLRLQCLCFTVSFVKKKKSPAETWAWPRRHSWCP